MQSRVSVVRQADYEPDGVRQAVLRAVELLGGVGKVASAGSRVLLKPNLLAAHAPEKAVTTHPSVVEAAAGVFSDAKLLLGDSPPLAGEKEASYKSLLDVTGMTGAAERFGAEIVRFEEAAAEVSSERGRLYKSFTVAKAAAEADAIVNLPKLKTHGLMGLTGAVKNLFGCIPGRGKPLFHARAADDVEQFGQMLVDLLAALPPKLTIMDAVVAMEGAGPSQGKPKQVGLILAGTDPVAIDAVISSIIGIEPFSVVTTRLAHKQGIGCGELGEIEVVGEPLDSIQVSDFVRSRASNPWAKLPYSVRRVLKRQLVASPRVVNEACKKCGECIRACPVEAMGKLGRRPEIDLDKCIRCYCCHEVCKFGAIDLKRAWPGRWMLG